MAETSIAHYTQFSNDLKGDNMPIACVTIKSLDLCYARWMGHIDQEAVREHYSKLVKTGRTRPAAREIVDLRSVTKLDLDIDGLRLFIARTNGMGRKQDICTVILVGSPVSFGCARQYQSLAAQNENISVRIVESESAALKQLGIAELSVEDLLVSRSGKNSPADLSCSDSPITVH